jgi:hypothetical protein
MGTAILTAAVTVITGVIVYVAGQIVSKFLIEPYQEYRKVVGEIVFALVFYASVSGGTKEERQDEAWRAFRQNAARLRASVKNPVIVRR